MPANRKLKAKFKPHVSRTFILRKHEMLPIYSIGRAAHGETMKYIRRTDELGDAVFILDETNTRVCVTNLFGSAVWIPKYYLHKEAPSLLYQKLDNLCEALTGILEVSRNLRGDVVNLQESASQLEDIAKALRTFADEEQTRIKGT